MHSPISNGLWVRARSTVLLYLAVAQTLGAEASLIAFGNSYSDTGQGANVAVHAALGITQLNSDYFPAAPYYQGRFSNGPIYLETAASALGDVLNSFAAGGATVGVPGSSSVLPVYPPYAGEQSVVDVPIPSGVQQVAKFLSQNGGAARPQSTYILELGVNDYIEVVSGIENVTVSAVIQTINQILNTLYNAGARKFVVLNVPPFAGTPLLLPPLTPANQSAAAQALAANLTATHNSALTAMVTSFNQSHSGACVQIFDIYSFFVNLLTNAAKEGFTVSPITSPCYQAPNFFEGFTAGNQYPVCSNPDQHVFWDAVHLTKKANDLLAQDFVSTFPQLSES